MKNFSRLWLAALLLPLAAVANDGHHRTRPVPMLPAYQAECAACHLAFPPSLLPAPSWQRVMGGLDRHYGTDASLDDATVRQISAWLRANAGRGKQAREQPPEDRITRAAWFVREHDEVRPDVWRRASVKSAANCAACHPGAARGDFDEDTLRLPR